MGFECTQDPGSPVPPGPHESTMLGWKNPSILLSSYPSLVPADSAQEEIADHAEYRMYATSQHSPLRAGQQAISINK